MQRTKSVTNHQATGILSQTHGRMRVWTVCCLLVYGAACSPNPPRTDFGGAPPGFENVSQTEAAEILAVAKAVWAAVQARDEATVRRYADSEDVLQYLPEFREDSAAMLTPATSLTIMYATRHSPGIDTVSTVIGLPY